MTYRSISTLPAHLTFSVSTVSRSQLVGKLFGRTTTPTTSLRPRRGVAGEARTSTYSSTGRSAQIASSLRAARSFSRAHIHTSSMAPSRKHKVAVVGSGNWGTTICKVAAENVQQYPDLFEQEIQMWVFEEQCEVPQNKHGLSGKQPLSKISEWRFC